MESTKSNGVGKAKRPAPYWRKYLHVDCSGQMKTLLQRIDAMPADEYWHPQARLAVELAISPSHVRNLVSAAKKAGYLSSYDKVHGGMTYHVLKLLIPDVYDDEICDEQPIENTGDTTLVEPKIDPTTAFPVGAPAMGSIQRLVKKSDNGVIPTAVLVNDREKIIAEAFEVLAGGEYRPTDTGLLARASALGETTLVLALLRQFIVDNNLWRSVATMLSLGTRKYEAGLVRLAEVLHERIASIAGTFTTARSTVAVLRKGLRDEPAVWMHTLEILPDDVKKRSAAAKAERTCRGAPRVETLARVENGTTVQYKLVTCASCGCTHGEYLLGDSAYSHKLQELTKTPHPRGG